MATLKRWNGTAWVPVGADTYATTAQGAKADAAAPQSALDAGLATKAPASGAGSPAAALASAQSYADAGLATKAPIRQDYVALARTPDVLVSGAITRDANGVATAAPVTWPDGSPGDYTGTPSATIAGVIDGYAITYGSPVTKTYTQPTITRDSSGTAITVPAIVVS